MFEDGLACLGYDTILNGAWNTLFFFFFPFFFFFEGLLTCYIIRYTASFCFV